MENLSDALLIIDLQRVFADGETINHFSELITTVNLRIQRYREQNKLILFVQHCDEVRFVPHSETWEIVEERSQTERSYDSEDSRKFLLPY